MALITCPECGNQVSTDAKSCPKCGARTKPKSKALYWIIGTPLGLLILLAIIGSNPSPETAEKRQARAVYELCVSDMKDELRSREFREASRYMCERLRDDFVKKYGVQP